MLSVFKRGAEWRRWDLHIHTPESIEQNYGGPPAWPQFIEALEQLPTDVKVIGITDYYFLDGYERVITERLKNNRLKNLEKIFPILEFRIDTFGSASQNKLSKINVHVLFDVDESNIENEIKLIRERFIERICLTGSDEHKTVPLSKENMIKESSDGKLATGFRDFIPSTEKVFELLKDKQWKTKTLVFLGYEEWHSLDKGQQAKIQKERLYKRADAFLSQSSTDAIEKKQDVLRQFGNKVFFHSLDIHDFKQFQEYKCLTWIKADPSFKGLKHTLLNTAERVFIGHTPPRLEYERGKPEFFIDTLSFKSTTSHQGWFDDLEPILFNKGLMAIIGDKGNGKSALADIIALGGNSSRSHYSFLRKGQFLASPAHKRYSATLSFCDKAKPREFNLGDPKHDHSTPERVTYLSQSFVNHLCGEVGEAKELQAEIDRVIFAHLPEGKRLKKQSLDKVVEARAGTFDTNLTELRAGLSSINQVIVQLEDRLDGDYAERITELQNRKKEALALHEAAKPVPPPQSDTMAVSVKLVAKYVKRKAQLEELVTTRRTRVEDEEYALHQLQQAKERLLAMQDRVRELITELAADKVLAANGIDAASLANISINTQPIDAVCDLKSASITAENRYIERVQTAISTVSEFIERQRLEQTEAERLQNNFAVETQEWENKKRQLIGSNDTKDTLTWYASELQRISDEYPITLAAKHAERDQLAKQIVETLFAKEEAIKDIYSHVQSKAEEYASRLKIPVNQFIEFTARITIPDTFSDHLFALIDHNRTGTFYRLDRARARLEMLMPSQSDLDRNALLAFPEQILYAFSNNLQNDPPEPRNVKDQLIGDKSRTKCELYDLLYSFSYVTARFSITYTSKPISRLSPGEKGILLLAFYLLIDDNPNPVVVDQPEENVGNFSIAKLLVDFIKVARTRRQIIMVTHNANLAIVCDADQIIHCEMDKVNKNALIYSSGGIEYDAIKGQSINILEGTKESFDSRRNVWALLPREITE